MNSMQVLIIGGGLGGLCLAQGLKNKGVKVSVFERDLAQHDRPQGYRVRINEDGAAALRACLNDDLWSLFEATSAQEEPGQRGAGLDGPTGQLMKDWQGPPSRPGPSYAQDRTLLRSLLMLGLEEDIHFGKEFKCYTLSEDGSKVTAHFVDGSEVQGDLLVGADGWRSRVRRQYLPHHVPVDTDGRCIYGKTLITPELLAQFPKEALRGMSIVRDNRPMTLFLEPMRFSKDPAEVSSGRLHSVQDYVYWVLIFRLSTGGVSEDQLADLSHQEAVDLSLELTQSWHPTVRSLLQLQSIDQASALRICSFKPEFPEWDPSARITLLGDAVHVMSPTGGVGANTALQDARKLIAAITRAECSLPTAIADYEIEMRVYARKAIEGSYMGGQKLYNQPPFDQCRPVELS